MAGANLQRSYALISFCLVIGILGWVITIASGPVLTIGVLLLFVVLAILTELAGFRIPPADPHSLTGMVLLGATLALGPPNGALIGAVAGLIFGVVYPLLVAGPRSFYILGARPIFRSGLRGMAILTGGALAAALGFSPSSAWSLLAIIPVYILIIQVGRDDFCVNCLVQMLRSATLAMTTLLSVQVITGACPRGKRTVALLDRAVVLSLV